MPPPPEMTFRPLHPVPICCSTHPGVPESGDPKPHRRSCACASTWYIGTAGVVHVTDAVAADAPNAAPADASTPMEVASAITPAVSVAPRSGILCATLPMSLLGLDTLLLLVCKCL